MEKKRVTFLIPNDLADEIRDTVVFLAGHPVYLSMAQFAEEACRAYIEKLKKEHNHNKPFPKGARKPKVGRPLREN